MGWAENRVAEYQGGQPASWLERRMLEHANRVHFPMAMAASVGFAYGLWTHSWPWVIGSSALALSGHVYCWTREATRARQARDAPESDASALKT